MLRVVGRRKGDVIAVDAGEKRVVRRPVYVTCDSLQRGKIVLHAILLFSHCGTVYCNTWNRLSVCGFLILRCW